MAFTASQSRAMNTLLSGLNTFISGGPGTGKSYLINEFIRLAQENDKNIIVTAPTGLAAMKINGATVHRQFNVPLGPVIDKPKKVPRDLLHADSIIIDEIGMCRADVFDYLYVELAKVNIERRKRHQKDVQVIVAGDFFQLPPVVTPRDKEVLRNFYPDCYNEMYAFQSNYWDNLGFVVCRLEEAVRQDNRVFVSALEQARTGNKQSLKYFVGNSSKTYLDNGILLCGTNKAVDEKNISELKKIKGIEGVYVSEIEGTVTESDKPVPDLLRVKVGARVMAVVNDGCEDYFNGSLGTVTKLGQDFVTVRFDDSGVEIPIPSHTFEIKKFVYDAKKKKMMSETIGKYSQIPLKVAYAVTIHKCQGQTYDAVNIDPVCWDRGQLYTAISRCRKIENVHFTREIEPSYLVASSSVRRFYNM